MATVKKEAQETAGSKRGFCGKDPDTRGLEARAINLRLQPAGSWKWPDKAGKAPGRKA